MMEETLKEITKSLLSDRCENCKYGLKHIQRGELRKWCAECICVWNRREHLTEAKAERQILDIVGLKYLEATIEKLNKHLIRKLNNLEMRQDLYIHGDVGVGKTYTTAALIRKYIYEGYLCKRINFDGFCVKIRSTFAPAAKATAYDLIKELKKCDKLFIDDLGLKSEPESQFAYDTLYDLINKRQENMRPTYISSNKTIEQLSETFDLRIASRLSTALIIEIKGKDRRSEILQERK